MKSIPSSQRFWAYAATFGAAWGVVELTLGAFIHALRVPFVGTFLACCAAALLIAERQIFPRPGITLLTGIIAAACKSISPDGTIFGPMLGIIGEALVIEIALTLLANTWIATILAGGLASLLPISQKLLTQVAFYGGTMLTLYEELLRRLASLVHATDQDLLHTGLGVLIALMTLGATFGVIGRLAGRKAALRAVFSPIPVPPQPATATDAPPSRHRAVLNSLIFIVALIAIAIQFQGSLSHSIAALLLLGTTLALFCPRALKRMWRPKFWIASLVFALFCGLLLGPKNLMVPGFTTPLISSVGASAGLLMVLRGAFIFSLTSWASVSLNRKTFLAVFDRIGLQSLGIAITTAFEIMPQLRPIVTGISHRSIWDHFCAILATVASLAEQNRTPKLIAVIGPKRSGKTSTLMRLFEDCRNQGLSCGGICQPSTDAEGSAYDLLDLATGDRQRFATRNPGGRGCSFDDDGWKWAASRFKNATQSCQIVFIDELGKLEAQGKGHIPALRSAVESAASAKAAKVFVLAVQSSVSDEIGAKIGGFDHIIPARDCPNLDSAQKRLSGQNSF